MKGSEIGRVSLRGSRVLVAASLIAGLLGGVGSVAAADPPAYTITSASPPATVLQGAAYTHTFQGSPAGATWTSVGNPLPDGLSLDPNTGVLSGVPTTAGLVDNLMVEASWAGTYSQVAAGNAHTCAIVAESGRAECWGDNGYGQAASQAGPFSFVETGGGQSCGILQADSSVVCWGQNDYGQGSPPAGAFTSLSIGMFHTCGILVDGSVDCWGYGLAGSTDSQVGPYSAVTVDYFHSCGLLTSTGAVDCWGYNSAGEGVDRPGPYTAVATDYDHTCGILASDGSADCWGSNTYGQGTGQVGPFSKIATGDMYTCAVRAADGAIDCWGSNDQGRATDQSASYVAVNGGTYHTCGILATGDVDCWGYNGWGQATDHSAELTATESFTIDVALAPAISGTVTDATSGDPLPGIRVRLYDGTVAVTTAVTDAAGSYTLSGLSESGVYRIRFHDPVGGLYSAEYNGDVTKFNLAPVIAVANGQTTTVDAGLALSVPPAAAIAGSVWYCSTCFGFPIGGITVSAYRNGVLVKSVVTDANGNYQIGGLDPTGVWTVRFRDSTYLFKREFWNDQGTLATATPLVMVPGGTVTANADLQFAT